MNLRMVSIGLTAGLLVILVACQRELAPAPSLTGTSTPPSGIPTPGATSSPMPPTNGPEILPAETAITASLQGQIVFHSDPNIGSDFYLMNPDGSGLLRLTDNFNTSAFAVVSPDVRWLSFSDRRNRDLFLLDLEAAGKGDNTAPINLTQSAQSETEPAWSPDSTKLAYVSYDTNHIYWLELDKDGGVVNNFDTQATGFEPAWSPNGTRLAFFSDRDGNAEIYVMEADGSGQTRLTDDPAADYTPRWSPDGQHILFISERDGNTEVYVMKSDGSGLLNVSDDPAPDEFAFWSPQGSRIVYVSYQDGADPSEIGMGNAEIFTVNADGTGKRNLTANEVWDGDPAWSPDGEWIVFTQRVGDQRQGHIHVMRADGSQQTRLVGEPGEWNDCCAVWRPANNDEE